MPFTIFLPNAIESDILHVAMHTDCFRTSTSFKKTPLSEQPLAHASVYVVAHALQQQRRRQQRQPHPPDALLFDASTTFATPLKIRKAAPATARILMALDASRLLSAKDAIARARGSWICGGVWRSSEWSTLATILSPSAPSPSSDDGLPMGGTASIDFQREGLNNLKTAFTVSNQ